jgi:hypothetical protein
VLSEVHAPQPVRDVGGKSPVDQVRMWIGPRIGDRASASPPPEHTLQPRAVHEPGDPFAVGPDPEAEPQLGMYSWRTVGAA